MVQEIIISITFLVALGYLAKLIYNNFQARSACSSGCGKCQVVDFEAIEKKLKQKGI
jgi:hypothetical protein